MSRHLYLIGIGGVGMIWIADYALKQGWQVSGSDVVDSPELERLRTAGANIQIGSSLETIPSDVSEVIITAAITPTAPSYPILETLQKRGVPVVKRAEWIGKLTRQYFTISVAGAHGKTTTTAMIGWILEQAGLDPTVFVGGTVTAWKGTRIGQGTYLVLESDEFDRSFHQFYPQIAVVLNIDLDHTDYYSGGLPEIEQAYRRFLRNLPMKTGIMIGYGRDGRVRKAASGFKYRFRWYDEQHLWPGVKVPQPGIHNLLNATAAARVAHELGVSQKVIKDALGSFPGVGRRFEHLGTWNQVELYDDYAHHPREIEATLAGLREKFPGENVTLVFQPHQKARTQALLKEFAQAFSKNQPGRLILAPIYQVAGREEGIKIESGAIAEQMGKHPNMEVVVAKDKPELEKVVKGASTAKGILMIMGAGDIRTLVDGWRK